jgi:hypothetical protein
MSETKMEPLVALEWKDYSFLGIWPGNWDSWEYARVLRAVSKHLKQELC